MPKRARSCTQLDCNEASRSGEITLGDSLSCSANAKRPQVGEPSQPTAPPGLGQGPAIGFPARGRAAVSEVHYGSGRTSIALMNTEESDPTESHPIVIVSGPSAAAVTVTSTSFHVLDAVGSSERFACLPFTATWNHPFALDSVW